MAVFAFSTTLEQTACFSCGGCKVSALNIKYRIILECPEIPEYMWHFIWKF